MMKEDPNLITVSITETLKNEITEWCGDLEVCDNDKFKLYFNRILNRDYPRYCEKLRWEVRTADNAPRYDFLVGNYLEREITRTNSSSQDTKNTTKENGSTSNTATSTPEGTETVETTGNDTRTPNLTKKTNYTGESILQKDGAENHNRTVKQAQRKTTQETQRNQTQNVDVTGNPETLTNDYDSHRGATKAGPMDANVVVGSEQSLPETANFSMGTIENVTPDFSGHASAIEQSADTKKTLSQEKTDSHTKTSYSGNADTVITTTAPVDSDSDNTAITYDKYRETSGYNDRVDTNTETGTEASEKQETTKTTAGIKTTTESSGTTEGGSEATGSVTGASSGSDKERLTGRQEAPADILMRAQAFIEQSSAWEWLYPRLLVCFQSFIEI